MQLPLALAAPLRLPPLSTPLLLRISATLALASGLAAFAPFATLPITPPFVTSHPPMIWFCGAALAALALLALWRVERYGIAALAALTLTQLWNGLIGREYLTATLWIVFCTLVFTTVRTSEQSHGVTVHAGKNPHHLRRLRHRLRCHLVADAAQCPDRGPQAHH